MILADQDSPPEAVWQLVESCGYTADLPVWSGITESASTVLDLGCGIGRVARHLARSDRPVFGVDREPILVTELNRLSAGEPVTAFTGDVTALDELQLPSERYDAVIAPQQLLHIVGGEVSRQNLLDGVRERLQPDGLAAFAFSEWASEGSHEVAVMPDVREVGDWVYASRPVAVEDDGELLTITRLRQVVSPEGRFEESEDRITLDRLDRDLLASELAEAGLQAFRTIDVPETDQHIATVIVVARHVAVSG